MWEYTRKVKYYETDRMGVVHHSNYLRLIEDARMCWIDDNIMKYSDMERMGVIIPAVNAVGNFRAFLRFDDEFSIRITPGKFTSVRFLLKYEIYNKATGELCYDGSTTHYFAADGDYRPISIKRKFPELYERYEAVMKA